MLDDILGKMDSMADGSWKKTVQKKRGRVLPIAQQSSFEQDLERVRKKQKIDVEKKNQRKGSTRSMARRGQ